MEDPSPISPAQAADLDTVLAGLRAAGESTRLRIVAVLAEGELTVSELCRILGQTQPRVSRHLRLLCAAGLLVRHSEGTSAFYSYTRAEPGRSLLRSVLALIDHDDRTLRGDRQRLEAIRAERASAADRYFEQIADRWDRVRSHHVADAEVEAALLAAAGPGDGREGRSLGRLIDIGTGTGRILELFADRIDRGLGIDLSTGMLNLARSNLVARDLYHCSVRHGNVYALEVTPRSFDIAVVHHVLHFLEDPAAALAEAAATLKPGGRLLVVDFAPHDLEELRSDHAHRRLGFADAEVTDWCHEAGLTDITVQHLVPTGAGTAEAPGELLTVSLWTAIQPTNRSDPTESDRPTGELTPAGDGR